MADSKSGAHPRLHRGRADSAAAHLAAPRRYPHPLPGESPKRKGGHRLVRRGTDRFIGETQRARIKALSRRAVVPPGHARRGGGGLDSGLGPRVVHLQARRTHRRGPSKHHLSPHAILVPRLLQRQAHRRPGLPHQQRHGSHLLFPLRLPDGLRDGYHHDRRRRGHVVLHGLGAGAGNPRHLSVRRLVDGGHPREAHRRFSRVQPRLGGHDQHPRRHHPRRPGRQGLCPGTAGGRTVQGDQRPHRGGQRSGESSLDLFLAHGGPAQPAGAHHRLGGGDMARVRSTDHRRRAHRLPRLYRQVLRQARIHVQDGRPHPARRGLRPAHLRGARPRAQRSRTLKSDPARPPERGDLPVEGGLSVRQ